MVLNKREDKGHATINVLDKGPNPKAKLNDRVNRHPKHNVTDFIHATILEGKYRSTHGLRYSGPVVAESDVNMGKIKVVPFNLRGIVDDTVVHGKITPICMPNNCR